MGCVVIQILWLTQGGNCMANKEYKSDVFSMLLQDKKRAMEIYNAINGTDYDDPELVEMTTLDDKSFSLTVRNDASFRTVSEKLLSSKVVISTSSGSS